MSHRGPRKASGRHRHRSALHIQVWYSVLRGACTSFVRLEVPDGASIQHKQVQFFQLV